MQKNKLNYLRDIKEALKTYNEEHQIVDFELIQKIYGYSENLDNLTEIELHELDSFIAENTISIHHLANIYLDKKGEENLNHMLTKMLPLQITKPQSNIKFIKGKEEILTDAIYQINKVRVLCKKRKNYQKLHKTFFFHKHFT